jgi:lipopolysaccharide biosynthesis glycosyltransferase
VDIDVVIYLDASYAAPATAMVASLLEHAAPSHRIRLFALVLSLDPAIKRVMEASWPRERLDVRWVDLDWKQYERSFTAVGHLSRAAYARLLIDRCLPPAVERAITLDCDGLMLDDVGELWQRAPSTHAVSAVPDPCLLQLADDRSDFLQSPAAERERPYLNSGLMVVDLKRWRNQRISDRCLELAARHVGRAAVADQSILNAVLRGAWEPLPVRWNCSGRHLAMHAYPSLRDRVYPYAEVREAMERPGFLHFLSRRKPWHATPFHPHRRIYRQYLAKTGWRDAAPQLSQSPRQRLAAAFQERAFPWRCFREAARLRRSRGIPPRPLADLRHLASGLWR